MDTMEFWDRGGRVAPQLYLPRLFDLLLGICLVTLAQNAIDSSETVPEMCCDVAALGGLLI